MTAKVIYNGGLRTTSTHLQSGSTIETDAPTDNHGKGERFSPTDLVTVATATCILTTIALSLEAHKRDISIDGAICDVQKIMASNPRRIAEIKIDLSFASSAPFSDHDKALISHAAHNCPVMLSLSENCQKTLNITWPPSAE
ncbi:MAG: OsmC family peroxiredoxin [Chitinophagia bacterium]|nr:OsmC family peroxiredoxin [Chitinophagia bacterium]